MLLNELLSTIQLGLGTLSSPVFNTEELGSLCLCFYIELCEEILPLLCVEQDSG